MKALILLGTIFLTLSAYANQHEMASTAPKANCQHMDGDGNYSATGETLHSARTASTEQCFNHKLDLYAARHGGAVPDDDQIDLIMDSCVNICRK